MLQLVVTAICYCVLACVFDLVAMCCDCCCVVSVLAVCDDCCCCRLVLSMLLCVFLFVSVAVGIYVLVMLFICVGMRCCVALFGAAACYPSCVDGVRCRLFRVIGACCLLFVVVTGSRCVLLFVAV